VAILQAHAIIRVVDVRTIPRSRHNPQFNRETLPEALNAAGIGYQHLPGLGGLRQARADSSNLGWRNTGFRGYADYMQTAEFEENLNALIELAKNDRVAVMCAEAMPWRCHRSMIADALLLRGVQVEHIMGAHQSQAHSLTPFAKVEGLRISYPDENEQQKLID
jgi:uncharacterized protein (DUF488 family)